MLGLIGIASGWLLLVTTTTTDSPLTSPVVGPIVAGTVVLFLGLHRFIRPAPDVVVDDQGVVLDPYGRIPWVAISRVHLITVHGTRYLAVELVEARPRITEKRWPRWVYGPAAKIIVGYPLTVSERWLRPISLDDIAAELHRRTPELVIARSEQSGFGRGQS
ncbi:hypothetical protein [Nocardia pseudobrasiliensis]|uniref:hypothetical protein n=1 Tax=Nocardia pseudobrasiliensis TaxID=45979 RepID=UPI0011C06497|nr:hypothetical protein [Nocardia pseudobrasiliensis]